MEVADLRRVPAGTKEWAVYLGKERISPVGGMSSEEADIWSRGYVAGYNAAVKKFQKTTGAVVVVS